MDAYTFRRGTLKDLYRIKGPTLRNGEHAVACILLK